MNSHSRRKSNSKKGFTLIELLVVIAIIAILAAVVFVALNPAKRFADARDSRRWSDVNQLLSAIKLDQVDNKGSYSSEIEALTAGAPYMIGTCTTGANAKSCGVTITNTACADLDDGTDGLIDEGYLGSIPFAPKKPGTTVTWDSEFSGYTIKKDASGIVTIQACDKEDSTANDIKVSG